MEEDLNYGLVVTGRLASQVSLERLVLLLDRPGSRLCEGFLYDLVGEERREEIVKLVLNRGKVRSCYLSDSAIPDSATK